jgi:hypothetical protein
MTSGSRWLGEAAFTQVTRLGALPRSVERWIADWVLGMAVEGRLRRNWQETRAFLLRLPSPRKLLDSARLLYWMPWIDAVLIVAAVGTAVVAQPARVSYTRIWMSAALMLSSLQLGFWSARWWWPSTFSRVVILPTMTMLPRAVVFGSLLALSGHSVAVRHSMAERLASPFVAYFALWCPLALLTYIRGRASPPIRWIAAEVFYLPLFLLVPKKALEFGRELSVVVIEIAEIVGRPFKRWPVRSTAGVAGVLAIVALCWFFPTALRFSFFAIMLALGVLALRGLWFHVLDMRAYVEISRGEELDALEAIQFWGAIRFAWLRVKSIQDVTRRELIPPTDRAIQLIRGLALLLEQDIAGTHHTPANAGPVELGQWSVEYVRAGPTKLRKWGEDALDALCRLEQRLLDANRRTPSRPDAARPATASGASDAADVS